MTSPDAGAGAAAAGWRDLALDVLRGQRYLMAVAVTYIAAVYGAASGLGRIDDVSLWHYYSLSIAPFHVVYLLLFILGRLAYVMAVVRPPHITRHFAAEMAGRFFTLRRIVVALPALLFVPAFLSAFTSFKAMIPDINPFSWDPDFAQLDFLLHGGNHPWALLQPLLGYPVVTQAINLVYLSWFFLLHGVLFWQAFSLRAPLLRTRFFLTFALSWALLGSLGAVYFSSAGPCYYGLVTGLEDPFLPLMDYLRSVEQTVGLPILLGAQAGLWQAYQASGTEAFAGISAMPSMHLAMTTLFTLVCWRTSRLLGLAFGIYTLVMLLGSVHLGWHYAVDGYAAIAGVWLIWLVVGRLLGPEPQMSASSINF
jgi:hypothetical protein